MKAKVTAGIITTAILVILLLTGPAEAFILGLTVLDPEVDKGETISFTASIEINAQEHLDIDYLVLRLNGPMDTACEFLTDGTILRNCPGIIIMQIGTAPYDYGYGFTDGNLTYKITLDTSGYFSGTYTTQIEMVIGEYMYTKTGDSIIIKPTLEELQGCSVRAKGDEIISGESEFGEGKINFYIPLKNADKGKGTLTGQKDKDRLSYKFDIIEVIENTPDHARILISGESKIRVDRKTEKADETAEIYFDKTNSKVSLKSIGDGSLDVEGMEIYFRKKC